MKKFYLSVICFFLVNVSLLHAQGPLVNLGNDTLVCAGDNFILDAGPGFLSYSWDNGSTNQVQTITGPGTYGVTVTNFSGIQSSDAINIGVAPNPVAEILGPSTRRVCKGEPIELSAINLVLDAYLWSTGNTSGSILTDVPGTYEVTVFNEYDCIDTDVVTVELYTPVPSVTLGGDQFLCESSTATITAFGSSFQTWLWSTGQTTPQIDINSPGIYSVTVRDGNGCPAKDTVNITQVPLPQVNIGPDFELCANETASLAAPPGYKSYHWSNDQWATAININEGGSYNVTITDNFNCSNVSNTVVVTELPVPDAQLVSVGDRMIATGGVSYQWFFNEREIEESGQVFFPSSSGNVMVKVTDENGCVQSTNSVFFDINDKENGLPQGISPNNDGINDEWNSSIFNSYPNNVFKVFNRWGNEVWGTRGYMGEWNGVNKSGNDLPEGTYFYTLDLNDGFSPIKGYIVIFR